MIVDTWTPVTADMGLIQAPVDEVATAFLEWHDSLGLSHEVRRLSSGLGDALESLLPLSNGMRRRLFVPTRSDWTAQFQSGIQGSDPFPAMAFLAEKLGVLAMRVCSTPPTATYPATIWEVYAPPHLSGGPLNYRRSIASANDGDRWVFHQSGEPYPFEEMEQYSRPRKRGRFTREMLARYLGRFGVDPFSDDFYVVDSERNAVLLQRPSLANEPPEFSLDEVKAGVPWRRSAKL